MGIFRRCKTRIAGYATETAVFHSCNSVMRAISYNRKYDPCTPGAFERFVAFGKTGGRRGMSPHNAHDR